MQRHSKNICKSNQAGSPFNDEPPTTKMNPLNLLRFYYYTGHTYATICEYKAESVAESKKITNAGKPHKSLQNWAFHGILRRLKSMIKVLFICDGRATDELLFTVSIGGKFYKVYKCKISPQGLRSSLRACHRQAAPLHKSACF